jgi:hypothetical protein
MSDVFTLDITAVEKKRFVVSVHHASGVEPKGDVVLPWDVPTREAVLQVLEWRDLSKCTLDKAQRDKLTELGCIRDGYLVEEKALNRLLGEQLFQALCPFHQDADKDVRAALRAAVQSARSAETPQALPVRLRFDKECVDLARLPWELLCDGGDHLLLSDRVSLTRYVAMATATDELREVDCLNVLLVSARPSDMPDLPEQAESQAILAALQTLQQNHRVRVQALTPPTLDALRAALEAQPYHIVHFDGHGGLGRYCPRCRAYQCTELPTCPNPNCQARLDEPSAKGLLFFERSAQDRRADPVSAENLAEKLRGRGVSLVVASACQSAEIGGRSVLASVGPGLLTAGVPAVLAMQFSLPMGSAVSFAGEFYTALAREESVAASVAAGRRALHARGTWYIPTLYLRSEDGEGHIFRFHETGREHPEVIGSDARGTRVYLWPDEAGQPDWASRLPRGATPFQFLDPYETDDAALFAGRDDEMNRLLGEVLQRRWVTLLGPEGVGKTSLVNAGLIPRLLVPDLERGRGRGYLVASLREYGEPVPMLRKVLLACPELRDARAGVQAAGTLNDLLTGLARDCARPVLLVLDEFEEFLRSADAVRREAFFTDFSACVNATYQQPVCLLPVVRDDFQGALRELEALTGETLGLRFPLGLLSARQAEQSIQRALQQCKPPIGVDGRFLREELLPALSAEQGGGDINPVHLQIVCHKLYEAARRQDPPSFNGDIYSGADTAAILKEHLAQVLEQHFAEPARRELARALLKQTVSSAGNRVFVTAAEAAAGARVEVAEAQTVFDDLLGWQVGLLAQGSGPQGQPTFALSHDAYVPVVQSWFSREEAQTQCARETLRRAWEDWLGQRDTARRAGQALAPHDELLVAPDRLRELRAQRARIAITGPQLCLLLRSAVRHRCDMDYWAQQMQQDEPTRALLCALQGGDAPITADAALAPQALGLDAEKLTKGALAAAAVAHGNGVVRHTAALALPGLASAVPRGLGWRRTQALAQVQAAGLGLPGVSGGQLAAAAAWHTGIRLYEAGWPLLAQAVGTSLGGGLGLAVMMGLQVLAVGMRDPGLVAAYMLEGQILGLCVALGRWLFGVIWSRTWGRAIGSALGFALGLVALWVFNPAMPATHLLGGVLAGAAIALGQGWLGGAEPVSATPRQLRRTLGRGALGAAAGGALAFAATVLTPMRLPFLLDPRYVTLPVPASWTLLAQIVLAALAGAALGAGLASGGVLGEAVWVRVREQTEGEEGSEGAG